MKRIWLILVAVVGVSLVAFSGTVITNDTGEDAAGLRVTFSSPVLITSFGDALTSIDPQMLSYEFVFSGGTVTPWDSQWFNYAPATASVVSTEWLTGTVVSGTPVGELARDDLLNLGRDPTYDEIMSVIAESPGDDEPLYEPGPDEQIWLTDLEGHADIYDNDSIKINYAPGFDQSQITKVEVSRNGIKMRFLPDKFDVLTNEQMKTFDGNAAEKTPVSSHTDHAIFGYTYEISFFGRDGTLLAELRTIIRSPIRFDDERFLNIGIVTDIIGNPSDWLVERFEAYREMGFTGISFSIYYITDSAASNSVHRAEFVDPSVHPWARTLTDAEIQKVLRAIDDAGLMSEVRIEIWVSLRTAASDSSNHRGALHPVDLEEWFTNYASLCRTLGEILEDEGCDIFTPIVELSSLERYDTQIRSLLADIRTVFSGRLMVSSQTQTHLAWGSTYDDETNFETIADRATFWGFEDLEIGLNCWPSGAWETQNDQRFSVLVERAFSFWARAFSYYRSRYPGKPIVFAEMGNFNFDGSSRGYDYFLRELGYNPGGPTPGVPPTVIDNQEDADLRSALVIAAEALGAAGVEIYKIYPWSPYAQGEQLLGDIAINGSPSVMSYSALMGGDARQTGLDPSHTPCMELGAETPVLDWSGSSMLSWPSSPQITYVLEGTGVLPLSRAVNWGLTGSRVTEAMVIAGENSLALRIQLSEGDRLGHYRYIFGFGPDNDRLYVFLNTDGRAEVAHQTPTKWDWLETVSGSHVGYCDDYMEAVIPFSVIRSYLVDGHWLASSFNFHIDYIAPSGRELFLFPGSILVPPAR